MEENGADDFFKTELSEAMDPLTGSRSVFGIMDLANSHITEIPNFTEEATLKAMQMLNISPDELVFDSLSDYNGDNTLKLQISIDLEEKRLKILKKLISTRQKIINNRHKLPQLPRKPKRIPQKEEICFSNRRKLRAKSSARSSASMYSRMTINEETTHRRKKSQSVEQQEEKKKNQQEEIIRKRAAIRLKQQEHNTKLLSEQIEKSRVQNQIEMQKQEQRMNKIQERKKKQYEQEMKWRRENIYKSAQPKPSHSSIAALRKKLLVSHSVEKDDSRSVSDLSLQKGTKIPRLTRK